MNIKKNLTVIAIALLLAFFVGYGIEVFNPAPDRDDIYREELYEFRNESDCIAAGGEWTTHSRVPKPVEENEGFCQPSKESYEAYDNARDKHDKVVFITAIIFGLAAIITGLLLKLDTISTGLTAGGVLLLLYGTMRYWRHANNLLKFILLGITLAILVLFAYKKLDKE